jgi:hypothetical protein
MTYARSRLWLGITTVGFWVVFCIIALRLNLPNLAQSYPILLVIPTSILAYIVISFPFDFMGGYSLPKKYNRTSHSFQQWLFSWVKGISAQGLCLLVLSLVLWQVCSFNQFWTQVLGVIGLQLCLAIFQPVFAAWIGQFEKIKKSNGQKVWKSEDIGFTGGVTALGQSIIPEQWQAALDDEQLSWVQQRRDAIAKQPVNLFGVFLAIGFNTAGFITITNLFGLQFQYSSDWMTLVFGFTLWSFLGVLVLPVVSQMAALRLDSENQNNTAPAVITSTVTQLDKWQDEEPARHPWIQRIFHPLPSVEQRINLIDEPKKTSTSGFWHAARRALYYSWPMMNLINRAVHCNVGRPDLWVFLPSEA